MPDEDASFRPGSLRRRRRSWALAAIGLLATLFAAAVLTLPVRTLATGLGSPEPRIIRIGVPYVPLPAEAPAARLYTEEGLELDFAGDIGVRLGSKVELVAVGGAAGAAALNAGRIDALLARADDEDPRFAGAEMVPTGYASGLSVAMRTDTGIRSWADLAGRTVCVSEANHHAQALGRASGAKLLVRRVPALSLIGVRTGECDAAIHDALLLERLFTDEQWRKFSATLPAREPTRLVAVLPGTGGRLAGRIRAAVEELGSAEAWALRRSNWARTVAFEVYLDQDAPDCH